VTKSEAKRQERAGERWARKRRREDWIKQMRCFWTWPFGHVWISAPGANAIPRLGPLETCAYCPADNYGNGEQSVGG
jgi:hypothetical protein